MAAKSITITNVFEAKMCTLCGSKDLSQFFEINSNFIEYCGVYFPLREILADCFNFHFLKERGDLIEICLECKERVLSFYHFKRRVRDAQDLLHHKRPNKFTDSGPSQEHSQIVHNIYKIIQDYTEVCQIQSISINKTNRKLIIEAHNEDSRCSQKRPRVDDPTFIGDSSVKSEISFSDQNYSNESIQNPCDESLSDEETGISDSSRAAVARKPLKKCQIAKTSFNKGNELGTLELSVSDVVNIFNAETNRFNDKYGDVFRKLMLSKYRIRVAVNFSFIGKKGIRVTLRCDKCRENYKVMGYRDDFVNKLRTTCAIVSTRSSFCKCGLF